MTPTSPYSTGGCYCHYVITCFVCLFKWLGSTYSAKCNSHVCSVSGVPYFFSLCFYSSTYLPTCHDWVVISHLLIKDCVSILLFFLNLCLDTCITLELLLEFRKFNYLPHSQPKTGGLNVPSPIFHENMRPCKCIQSSRLMETGMISFLSLAS